MKLKVYKRDLNEKPKRLRKSGMVPGIVYGKAVEKPIPVKVSCKDLMKLDLDSVNFLELEIVDNGESITTTAIIKEVQRDILSPAILHVDFQAVRSTDTVTVLVPVEVVGAENCIGLKKGGILQVNLKELELEVPVSNIPNRIKVDISNLDIADSIHVSELELPENYKPLEPGDSAVITILPPEEETEEGETTT